MQINISETFRKQDKNIVVVWWIHKMKTKTTGKEKEIIIMMKENDTLQIMNELENNGVNMKEEFKEAAKELQSG